MLNYNNRFYDIKDKMYIYSENEINNLSFSKTWYNSIQKNNDFKTDKNTKYKLHATGDMDLISGRKYIALP